MLRFCRVRTFKGTYGRYFNELLIYRQTCFTLRIINLLMIDPVT